MSKKAYWTGIVLTVLTVLFFLFDAIGHLLKPQAVVDSFVMLGIPLSNAVPLGLVLLVCTILYAIPRTSILGAILITGYLGGAVEANSRIGAPLFSTTLFAVYFGIIVWLAIYLRDEKLRSMIPFRK